ncbi:unnamed protein product, partial [Lampetra fluviatilis]
VSPPPCLRVSLDHLDELLQLRLTNLTAQSRWQPRYQVFHVGVHCGRRTRLYHELRHYKQRLLLHLVHILHNNHNHNNHNNNHNNNNADQAAELTHWGERYGNLQDLLRSADFFGENSCT